ncbi:hypothetical protein JG688_00014679 [Phytophthora aleatoria]|uniref:Uncharacterized protein n=1 Tax=Phytophthora aleatoria TaxID=2496075 RepID=A0A8J5I7F1_9STRA|nr:hypothetical protein JG688_00014679 [Phytophthora aleatoria]
MAAAAGAGRDVPGFNPADLKLNARLRRLLEMQFPDLTIHPIRDGSGISPIAAVSSVVTPAASSGTPAASGPVDSSAEGLASSASLLQRPLRTLDQFHRAPPSALTPKERLH